MPNYSQPDYRVPTNPFGVGIQIENETQPGAPGGNPLGVPSTQSFYVQPNISDRDDPHHGWRSGKTGT